MCKRSVARFNSNKRPKTETCNYTQGPLDETFGQHSAFPLDPAPGQEEDANVYQYLKLVRQEAEEDAAVHFVKRETGGSEPIRLEKSIQLPEDYVALVLLRLLSQKEHASKLQETSVGAIDLQSIIVDAEGSDGESLTENGPQLEEIQMTLENLDLTPEVHDASSETAENHTESSSEYPDIPETASAWRSLVLTLSPPPLGFFTEILEHATIIKLIVYYTKWILVLMSPTLSEWIFITFVRLDNGLDHTELALVRDLGRKAKKLRTKFLEGKKEGVEIPKVAEETVDMILAVVGSYYGQRDLLIEN